MIMKKTKFIFELILIASFCLTVGCKTYFCDPNLPLTDRCNQLEAQIEEWGDDDIFIETDIGNPKNCIKMILAAPHGAFDEQTDEVVRDIQRLSGGFPSVAPPTGDAFSYVIFHGFRTGDRDNNVNRPTKYETEAIDDIAILVYDCYRSTVRDLVGSFGDIDWYIEIHGNSLKETENYIDIAVSKSINDTEATKIYDWFKLTLDYIDEGLTPRVEKSNEGGSPYWTASASKETGILCLLDKQGVNYLHIEIPYEFRNNVDKRRKIVAAIGTALWAIRFDSGLTRRC